MNVSEDDLQIHKKLFYFNTSMLRYKRNNLSNFCHETIHNK